MEWVLRSPQIHSTFSNLGFPNADGYHISENCNATLETILNNILTEDKYLRSYRRNISFGQNIKKDLIPLLIHAKEDKTIELLIRILVNLTIPTECLLLVDAMSKSDYGRHTIFEVNNLLTSAKTAFTDNKAVKVVIEFLKKNGDVEQKGKLSQEPCINVSNSLLLLRNILHIPEKTGGQSPNNGSGHTVQNQILWNMFSHSVDKILIKLMTIPEATNWGVTMVQLVALLYKDQNINTLHKLLNQWLETSLSESSEDNESNTSALNRAGSEDSFPLVTSDPTSDSSDTGGSRKNNHEQNKGWDPNSDDMNAQNSNQMSQPPQQDNNGDKISQAPQDNDDDHILEASQPDYDGNQTSSPRQKDVDNQISPPPKQDNDGNQISQAPHYDNDGNQIPPLPRQDNDGDKMSPTLQQDNDGDQMSPLPQQDNEVTEKWTCNDNNNEKMEIDDDPIGVHGASDEISDTSQNKIKKKTVKSETSDCGYVTQIENNQESISTSSNEDDSPREKPVHQKPHNAKQRPNTKARSAPTAEERKRKKIVKRGKSNIINVQGLFHKTPTDDDISNVLKEFTVDFLLKGYNGLVQTLHCEIVANFNLEIDTSHFFWLVTYFLKFATQIELDLENVCGVLSYDIMSYFTAEGVNLCEQFELAIKLDGNNLTPCIRRLHLVVTAIREFVQAIEMYKKFSHLNKDDYEFLVDLEIKICETEELRSLFVLLLRHYNPKYHSKQYLQDLIVTNHILLLFMENVMKLPEYKASMNMMDHLGQFASNEIMYNYGLLLEDYTSNGEYVNDCIFTVMHHVGGELGCLVTLLQPKILKTYTSIWKSDYEVDDDWLDLIEYVINTFVKKPNTSHSSFNIRPNMEPYDEDKVFVKPAPPKADVQKKSCKSSSSITSDKWTEEEVTSLSWKYMQGSAKNDVIGEIVKLLKEDGMIRSRRSVIKELFKQNVISKYEFEQYMRSEIDAKIRNVHINKESRENEISKLCEQLTQDGKGHSLDWLQKVLLETCYSKLYHEKKSKKPTVIENEEAKLSEFEFKKKCDSFPVMSAVSYHSLLFSQSVPLVPWNCKQAAICKDLKFLQLLHKLGFHMPVDSGKVFIRIPHFWTADFLYDVACKISPVDPSKLKFSVNELSECNIKFKAEDTLAMATDVPKDMNILDTPEHLFQIHKQTLATMVKYTPMPGTSWDSEGGEIDKQNWFKVVQQSQECKISLNLDGVAKNEDVQVKEVVTKSVIESEKLLIPDPVTNAASSLIMGAKLPLTTPFIIPSTIMSVKQDTASPDIAHLTDHDSLCDETASVASDLTRMYVSDEDEKSDIIIMRPTLVTTFDEVDFDMEDISPKRIRVQL